MLSKWLQEEEGQVLEPERAAVIGSKKTSGRDCRNGKQLSEKLPLDPLSGESGIDTGAEEELFRRTGEQAAAQAMAARWEQSDADVKVGCGQCRQPMQHWATAEKRRSRQSVVQSVCRVALAHASNCARPWMNGCRWTKRESPRD